METQIRAHQPRYWRPQEIAIDVMRGAGPTWQRLEEDGEQWNWVELPVFVERSGATLLISSDTGQALMDDLWRCGLRPTEGAGSAGAMAATQRHLEDMRTLVFKPAG